MARINGLQKCICENPFDSRFLDFENIASKEVRKYFKSRGDILDDEIDLEITELWKEIGTRHTYKELLRLGEEVIESLALEMM